MVRSVAVLRPTREPGETVAPQRRREATGRRPSPADVEHFVAVLPPREAPGRAGLRLHRGGGPATDAPPCRTRAAPASRAASVRTGRVGGQPGGSPERDVESGQAAAPRLGGRLRVPAAGRSLEPLRSAFRGIGLPRRARQGWADRHRGAAHRSSSDGARRQPNRPPRLRRRPASPPPRSAPTSSGARRARRRTRPCSHDEPRTGCAPPETRGGRGRGVCARRLPWPTQT